MPGERAVIELLGDADLIELIGEVEHAREPRQAACAEYFVRTTGGKQYTYAVHLDSLIRDGNVSSNVALQPGGILIIPQRLF